MLELDSHWFFGSSPEFVLIVAGIHVSEQSGVEVAHWIRVKLASRSQPTRLGAIVIPEVFPAGGKNARTAEWQKGRGALGPFREKGNGTTDVYPARHFPRPGESLASLLKVGKVTIDTKEFPLLAEIKYVINVVETSKPVRIVSVHGKLPRTKAHLIKARAENIITMSDDELDKWDGSAIKGLNFPGIFVDPRYQLSNACQGTNVEPCKFDQALDPAFPTSGDAKNKRFASARTSDGRKDDAIALAAAKAVSDKTLVAGNHIGDPVEVVHYAKEGATPSAFSLGDWGPVDVDPSGKSRGSRPGAPVFTIEVKDNDESWAFLDGVQVMDKDGKPLKSEPTPAERAVGKKAHDLDVPKKFSQKRSKELQSYAQAIIDTILELP